MTATDELRHMLDERGVEHRVSATGYSIDIGPYITAYANRSDTTLDVSLRNFTPEQAIAATLGKEVTGETSDGYHTFNELYHHRAVLFSVIVRDYKELAWKSKLHHDGTMYDGMFIVGIETPTGQATYHYDIDPYWEMFDCKELEQAPEWDGHTPTDAIARIATLGRGTCRADETDTLDCVCDGIGRYGQRVTVHVMECSACGGTYEHVNGAYEFCPRCGRKVVDA